MEWNLALMEDKIYNSVCGTIGEVEWCIVTLQDQDAMIATSSGIKSENDSLETGCRTHKS